MAFAAGKVERDELIRLARSLATRCGAQASRQASAALAILRAQGLQGLTRALDPNLRLGLGTTTAHWERFRRLCGPEIRRWSPRGEKVVAFLLVWIRRCGRIAEGRAQGKRAGRPSR